MTKRMSTLVFLDFEATGLNNGKTKITELALLSVQRDELSTPYGFPRVINKLTLCVNPQKPISPRASEITGLYNENLELQSTFDGHVVDMMVNYLTRLPQPVCLIAHYGNGFDFKLLTSELQKIEKVMPDNLYCADSLEALRELDGLSPLYMTPVKASPSSATPLQETGLSQLAENVNNTTPIGQQIPSDIECPDIKLHARQAKRKIDSDLDSIPLKAKTCRKRLFESSNKTDQDETSLKLLDDSDLADQAASEKSNSNESSMEVKIDVGPVKKRLDFENVTVPQTIEDASELQSENETCNTLSQASIPDDVLLQAVSSIEERKSSDVTDVDSVQTVQKSPENVNKNCHEKKECSHGEKSSSEIRIITQRINTKMSYTLSRAEHHDKVMSILTESSDHGPIASYETNHKHIHKMHEASGEVTPKKVTETLATDKCVSLVQCSTAKPQVVSLESNKNYENDDTTQRETTPSRLTNNSDFSTPVKENQRDNDNKQDTPLSHYQPRVSYKLIEIYKRTFGNPPPVSHAAEDDCVTLMKVAKKRSPEFIQWVDEHAVLFSTISPL